MSSDIRDLTGRTIKGYLLKELVGHGGFGAVYRAYQQSVDREVAFKVVLPEFANQPEFIRRFESEAQMVARLEHLHIVPLFDYWREPGLACLVMRYLRGGSLQSSIERNGAWSIESASRLLTQIAGALNVAHRNSVIHRDIKPANILLDEEGNAYLADFGIAKKLMLAEPQIVTEEDRYGSPAFISPEQVMGDPVSPQTDIYSLGMVLYVMLTGQTPFYDPDTSTIIRRQLSEVLPPLGNLRADLPYAINVILWRATSKQPDKRYPDALTMAAEFRQAIASESNPVSVLTQLSNPSVGGSAGITQGGQTLILEPPPTPSNPYKGLRAFDEADASDFFGRTKLIDRMIGRIETESLKFLAVVGPSGSGKSSVVKAGLIPALKRGMIIGSQDWYYAQFVPGSQPIEQLADALLGVAVNSPGDLPQRLRRSDDALIELSKVILPSSKAELIIVIDQFEEIFTLVTDETTRAHFLRLLHRAATEPKSHVRIIITLRADLYDRPLLYPGIGELLRDFTEIILPLTSTEMELAIIAPAERYGLFFEPGLVSEIITDVKQQPGALPLLQYTLTELYEQRDGVTLTREAYHAIGGVTGALAKRADEIFEQLDSASQKAAKQLFLRLVTLNDGAEDTRRRAIRSELNAIASDKRVVQDVIDTFGKHRLLTFDYEPTTRTPTIEIAHEALIREWGKLRGWLDADREELRLYRRLSMAASEWIKNERDSSFLASGSRLVQFEPLAVSSSLKLTDYESTFLWASVAARENTAIRNRNIMLGLALFALFAVALAIFAFNRQQLAQQEQIRADNEARISRSRELAITSLAGSDSVDQSLLLSLESFNAANTYEARNSLVSNLQRHPRLSHILTGHSDGVYAVAYSPDGQLLASGGRDNAILLWDTQTNQLIGAPLTGHADYVNSLAFSPNGNTLLSGSSDGTVRHWDVSTGQSIGEPLISYSEDAIFAVAYNPSGNQFAASGNEDGSILLWSTADEDDQPNVLVGHTDVVYGLAFSPDGRLLASASADGTVHIWEAETAKSLYGPLTGHEDWVLSVGFSADGNQLASTGADSKIIFWDATSGEYLSELDSGHTNWVRSITFSSDGRYFATGSMDQTIRLWDATSGEQVGLPLAAHTDDVWQIAFSPDSRILASAARDQRVFLWDMVSSQPLERQVISQSDDILAIAYSNDGTLFATAGGRKGVDTNIYLWDAASLTPVRTFVGHRQLVSSLALSPDNQWLVSGSADGQVLVWDVATGNVLYRRSLEISALGLLVAVDVSPDGQTIAIGDGSNDITLLNSATGELIGSPLLGHSDDVQAVVFSADGNWLASGGYDRSIIIWDMSSREPSGAPLLGHNRKVTALAFSPDSQWLASGSEDAQIIVWDIRQRLAVGQPLEGHRSDISSLTFSPDGNLLISSSFDETIRLWDVKEQEPLGNSLTGHSNYVTSLAFSPDGSFLVSGGDDNLLIKWEMSLAAWKAQACSIANRNLSSQEWRRFMGDILQTPTCLLPIRE